MAKSKLTDEVQNAIVGAIEAGCYAKVAAEAAGVSETTFYRWLQEGEVAKSGRMREFWESVTRAQGLGEVNAVSTIASAAKSGDWRAAAWMLERRFSARWANTQKVQVLLEQEMEQLLDVMERSLEPHEFRRVASVLAGVRPDSGEEA